MTINSIRLYRYALPLKYPLVLAHKQLLTRDGLILEFKSDQAAGYGEIAPLAGFSSLDPDKAAMEVHMISEGLEALELSGKKEEVYSTISKTTSGLSPEVAAGLEMALLNLYAGIAVKSITHIFSPSSGKVSANALFMGSIGSWEEEMGSLLNAGYRSIKIKMTGNMKEDVSFFTNAASFLNGKAKIHIDVNRQWTLDEAVSFVNQIDRQALLYMEEPCRTFEETAQVFVKTKVPVALDETLMDRGLDFTLNCEGLSHIVLKPSRLYGVLPLRHWIKAAAARSIKAVISSNFETGLGLWYFSQFALGCEDPVSVGFDTVKWFKEDLLKFPPFQIKDGNLSVLNSQVLYEDFNQSYLTEMALS